MIDYIKHYHRIATVDQDADETIIVTNNKNPNIKKEYIFNITQEDKNKFPQLTVGKKLVIYVDNRNQVLYSEIV